IETGLWRKVSARPGQTADLSDKPHTPWDDCVKNRESFFHLHMISDATGETLITVARAAAAQYPTVRSIEHVYSMVRTVKQVDRIIDEIEQAPGIVLYTLIDRALGQRLEAACQSFAVPCVSVLDPIL